MYLFYLLEAVMFLAALAIFTWRVRQKEKTGKVLKRNFVFYYLLFMAGIIFSWGMSLNLLNAVFSRMVISSFLLIKIGDPFGAAWTVAAVIRWIMEIVWSAVLGGIFKRGSVRNLWTRQYAVFWGMPVISVIFLVSMFIMGSYYVSWNGYFLMFFNILLLFAMNLMVIYFYQIVTKSYETEKRYKLHRQREELLYRHYLKLEESYQSSRKIVHDLKNHMQAVTRLYEEGKMEEAKIYRAEVFHILNQTKHTWYTENRMLNIILNEKLCHEYLWDVKLELDIEENSLDRIREIDITTIFANLLDNAIEAIGPSGGDERFLKIKSQEIKDFLMIHIANSKGDAQEKGEEHQGLGLENVKEVLRRYEGTCTIEDEEKQFQIILLLPRYETIDQQGGNHNEKI